ncbi:integral membrane transporter [Polaribacter irgensii 23-P]|uniref:Integral membrane transporter n=1 Tax=Polaribacter irgensii 23-P TaxID=313594 RepID=A4C0K2_9FLAO|nr:OFA family MFS transporter [Polaribacter irgensii]EAR12945.1 integral membrane transporter [Polaribacter irgensii 23-P]
MYLNKENSIAKSNYKRWFAPIAALSIHLCIGQIYAFSVFNKPLTKIIGITEQLPEDWTLSELGWIFTLAIFFLGASTAVLGKWVEKVGPRKTMFFAAIFFSSGFLLSSLGIYIHELWMLYLGSGVLGGIGLGLGYISPVSTLMKWFPDRPGMAIGMAIMGFGGGAMIASPLSVYLIALYGTETSTGVSETFLTLGLLYLVMMLFGSLIIKIPREGWKPEGFDPTTARKSKLITTQNVLVDTAVKTPQFWLLFMVLGLNVSAGIGVLSQASVMIQEMFSSENKGATEAVTAIDAAIFVGLLSLFNMIGRIVWSTLSDYLGRKTTYSIFFILGIFLYILIPFTVQIGSMFLFTVAFSIIISMYGGGFATIPAYLRDLFGTKQIGAIHGKLLLAWSMAAIIGPITINYLREYQMEVLNVPSADVYNLTMYLMAGLLFIGLLCNLFIKPVDSKYHND